jgi:hypothetical protein
VCRSSPWYRRCNSGGIIRNEPLSGIRGPQKHGNFLRDIAICVVISKTAEKFRLKPTRSRYSTKPSGCSIVAQVLKMSESTVVDIWRVYGRLIFTGAIRGMISKTSVIEIRPELFGMTSLERCEY